MSFQSRQRLIDRPNLLVTPAVPRPALRQRLSLAFALWRQRTKARRYLAEMDTRSLRDLGISPAAAAYETGQPFWRAMGCLR